MVSKGTPLCTLTSENCSWGKTVRGLQVLRSAIAISPVAGLQTRLPLTPAVSGLPCSTRLPKALLASIMGMIGNSGRPLQIPYRGSNPSNPGFSFVLSCNIDIKITDVDRSTITNSSKVCFSTRNARTMCLIFCNNLSFFNKRVPFSK